MPIYEYECPKCKERFELIRSFNADDSDLKCPKCGADHPPRAISMFASGGSSGSACAPTTSG